MVALSRNVPRKRAMEMLLLGEMLPARRPRPSTASSTAWCRRASVMDEALALAALIASKPAATLAIGKEAFYRQIEMPLAEAYDYAAGVMVKNMLHAEAKEGIGAFIEKRPPDWDEELSARLSSCGPPHMNHASYTDAYIAGILGDAQDHRHGGRQRHHQPAELLRHEVSAGQGLSRDPRQSRPGRQGDPGPARLCLARRGAGPGRHRRHLPQLGRGARGHARGHPPEGHSSASRWSGCSSACATTRPRREAEAAGLQVVMNRCPKIEYGRLSGEIGWAGVNAGAISSKRPLLGGRGVQNHVIAGKR